MSLFLSPHSFVHESQHTILLFFYVSSTLSLSLCLFLLLFLLSLNISQVLFMQQMILQHFSFLRLTLFLSPLSLFSSQHPFYFGGCPRFRNYSFKWLPIILFPPTSTVTQMLFFQLSQAVIKTLQAILRIFLILPVNAV